jgi:ATP-binding protein involved in chromosome partitioning
MIMDFPPGTSDIQLTAAQKLNLTGAVIVTTPQEIAVNDARKAASMFNNNDIKVPILGIIENMSWFSPKPHPDEKYFIFGQGGGEKLAKELSVRFIGHIPLVAEVGEAAEQGLNIYNSNNGEIIKAFDKIVDAIL